MKIKKILVVMAIATLILAMTVATASATTDVENEKKNTGISIESKEKKVSSCKITWNANGGKIGTKKTKVTSVKKGSKIGKLVATPKRSGYTFQGWHTKKSGGKKVTKNTKITKKVTFYAIWKKKSRTLNAEEKKLVGAWSYGSWIPGGWSYSHTSSYYTYEKYNEGSSYACTYFFNADGTYVESYYGSGSFASGYGFKKANWAVTTKGKIRLTNIKETYANLKSSSGSYKDRVRSDKTDLYKIRVNSEGKQQITFHTPSLYSEDSDMYKWTIDEYIEKGFPYWHTKK